MSERLVLSHDSSRLLAALSRALQAAMRTSSLYPSEHPVVRAAIDRCRQALAAASEASLTSAVSVTPSTLLIRGSAAFDGLAESDAAAIGDVAASLHALGIVEIGFDAVVPAEALVRLVGALGTGLGSAVGGAGNVAEEWRRTGHPAIRIDALDYGTLLEDRPATTASDRDDIWRAIVSALRSGRRTLDEKEQQRLLALASDPAELAALAETVIAEKCTPDGSPMVTTQAETVLACFRHLASIAAVLAPDRATDILKNLAGALMRLDPYVSMQVLSIDGAAGGDGPSLAAGLGEEAIAELLATVIALEGCASPRLVQVFELLVPEPTGQRRVLERARLLFESRHGHSGQSTDSFWSSVEELLLSYNDKEFVSDEYRAVLDGSRSADRAVSVATLPEMHEWLDTLGDRSMRDLSVSLLADLLRLEPAADRAVIVLNQMGELSEELLLAGAFAEAVHLLDGISAAQSRNDVATAAAQVLDRLGRGDAVRATATMAGELGDAEWGILENCYRALGAAALFALSDLVLADHDTVSTERAGRVFVAAGDAAVAPLTALLERARSGGRRRIAQLLGRIGSPSAIPPLQMLLRSPDGAVLNAAVAALAGINDSAAGRAIHLALRTSDSQKRQMVVNALVAAGDRRAVPMLLSMLERCRPLGADFQVVLHALDALARLEDGRAVAAISRTLLLHSWFSRRRLRAIKQAAVEALVQIGGPSGMAALDEAARTGDRMLRAIIKASVTPVGAA